MHAVRLVLSLIAVTVLAGCASRPINDPLEKIDLTTGYRPLVKMRARENNDLATFFVMSFSGGGTRAAAFAYGALEELNSVEFDLNGSTRRLIDEVDVITGVSGGSFTALSYALYGEDLFADYEQRFLKRNVQSALLWRTLNPFNWPKLMGGNYGRSELAAEYYDEILFDNATFADLIAKPGPIAIATGTDLTTGGRLAFFQNDFDLLCSDLSTLNLSRAAATSSAVPAVLSPVTLSNYGGTCDYAYPPWADDLRNLDPRKRPAGRALQRLKEMESFQDSTNRPYLHLVDGGVADNIGVRGVFEAFEELGVSEKFREATGFAMVRRIVLIVVNSKSETVRNWERKESPPGTFVQLLQSSGVPIEHYSFETVELLKDRIAMYALRRDLAVAQAQLAGATREQAEASIPELKLTVLDISFDQILDPAERAYLKDLPTSFSLPPEAVDRLRSAAGELLRQSPEYQEYLQFLNARRVGGETSAQGTASTNQQARQSSVSTTTASNQQQRQTTSSANQDQRQTTTSGNQQQRQDASNQNVETRQTEATQRSQNYSEAYSSGGAYYGGYYPPPPAPSTATLPCNPNVLNVNGVTYYQCGQTYYLQAYGGTGPIYMPVPPPG